MRSASISEIGYNGPANHQYDIHDFFDALKAGNMPAVSILKAPANQDGHAGYSDPLLEQAFRRPMRLWSASPADGDFALWEAELCR
jgi:hypothetical protein